MSDRVASRPLLTRERSVSCTNLLAVDDRHSVGLRPRASTAAMGDCKVVVTAEAFGLTRDVVYEENHCQVSSLQMLANR